MELSAFAALSAGLIFVGTSHGEITSTILQTMMERDETAMKDTYAKFMALGLALLFLGKQDASDATVETLKAIESPLAKQALVLVEGCAYAATGNVLKIQKMLHYCNDHLDKEKEDDTYQSFAVLAIALVAIGEDIGSQMALRLLNQLVRCVTKGSTSLFRCIMENHRSDAWFPLLLVCYAPRTRLLPCWTR